MSEKKENLQVEISPEAEVVINKAKGFWENYSKPIIYIGSAVIALILGWYGYQHFIKEPKENSAKEMIFPAEKLFDQMANTGFNKDSVSIVLNGGTLEGNSITGILKVISQYGGTKAGNRARYIAGASYLQIGEYEKAIKYLKEFDGAGANQIQSRAFLMLGHAYAEQKKTTEALDYYKKAASVNEKDEAISADALLTAANYAKYTGKQKDAIDMLNKLKDKYPTSAPVMNGEVDKILASLGQFE